MKQTKLWIPVCLWILFFLAAGPAVQAADSTLKTLELADILKWKSIRQAEISDNGAWFGAQFTPVEGDGEVLIRETRGNKEYRFPCGDAGRSNVSIAFNADSTWAAFFVYPDAKEAKKLKKDKKPASKKVLLLNLANGEKTEFSKVKAFSFSGENRYWMIFHLESEAPSAPPGKGGKKKAPVGSDLLIHHLDSGNDFNVGNVLEFAVNKPGTRLAYLIGAGEMNGNGLQVRDLLNDTVRVLDSDKAQYKSLAWNEKGDALACVKGKDDKEFEDPLFSLLGFRWAGNSSPQKVLYEPSSDKTFPEGMTVSDHRVPQWLDDGSALIFGIHEVKKKEVSDDEKEKKKEKAAEPEKEKKIPEKKNGDEEKPGLVIWHWKDPRLQSQQQKEEQRDKNFSFICLYRVKEKKMVRLADETMRRVSLEPAWKWAVGFANEKYERLGNLDGRRYQDVYWINIQTGERKQALEKCRWPFNVSPDGSRFLYYQDNHFFTCDALSGTKTNITKQIPVSFIDTEDDHNVIDPPQRPFGWSSDGQYVLLSDGWDVWRVDALGSGGINLTGDGRKESIRYQRRFTLDPDEKGIDLAKPLYWSMYGEWTKKGGIASIDGRNGGAKRLLWDDAAFRRLMKAKKDDTFLYTYEKFNQSPEYYTAGATLKNGKRLTDTNPQQKEYAWSAGSQLVEYQSNDGKKLQGALYLPAGYEKGKSYPTIVYMYEKMSQYYNTYFTPSANGFNKSVYTSRGYAVLMPDIVFRVNDPGVSSTECILAALKAAVATGVVDPKLVGIHGHSWGGYQTAFIVTQTKAFKAAVAGAPLTNMVSMYSSIYWNSGLANQPIFESSQGRFTGGYWEQPEAYIRNSPVNFAGNVETPLIILHNDADGAVDWNQGIEYYNTLRRLNKPVVMLQYKGENHGLVKPENRKDYTVRMARFFDHYLMGKPAPKWLIQGVPHLKMEEYLDSLAKGKKEKN